MQFEVDAVPSCSGFYVFLSTYHRNLKKKLTRRFVVKKRILAVQLAKTIVAPNCTTLAPYLCQNQPDNTCISGTEIPPLSPSNRATSVS
jgi:hypothetical protein